jgi:hypothetical protein
MTDNIEHRVQALHGFPINNELTSDQDQYRLWFVANYQGDIKENRVMNQRETRTHLEQIAELSNEPYATALENIRGTYIDYLSARSDRLSEIVQDDRTDQFMSYATASREYLSKLSEAVDDHLGKLPEHIDESDIEVMQHVYLNLQEAQGYTQDYGYHLNPPKIDKPPGGYTA